jgi:hypothetical protein
MRSHHLNANHNESGSVGAPHRLGYRDQCQEPAGTGQSSATPRPVDRTALRSPATAEPFGTDDVPATSEQTAEVNLLQA